MTCLAVAYVSVVQKRKTTDQIVDYSAAHASVRLCV